MTITSFRKDSLIRVALDTRITTIQRLVHGWEIDLVKFENELSNSETEESTLHAHQALETAQNLIAMYNEDLNDLTAIRQNDYAI